MTTEASISANGLSLEVPIYLQHERNVKSWMPLLLGAAFDPPKRKLQPLLRDISFELKRGERLAILGRNGAGKSTLLRLLNGAYVPTQGQLNIRGTKQSLLNISLGFNAEATLKENILLRGAAMGLDARDIATRIEETLEFAGLTEKGNHRLKTLSAGQRMRLGFAISTAVQHDIMLMDEWIGTGDAEFVVKAKERLLSRVHGSQIVVLASHNVSLTKDICNRGLLLERGEVLYFGDIQQAVAEYNRLMVSAASGEPAEPIEPGGDPVGRFLGSVEIIELQGRDLIVKGWAIAGSDRSPRMLRAIVGDRHFTVSDYHRFARPDVQKHLGLEFALCGYSAKFADIGLGSLSDLGRGFAVMGGDEEEDFSKPFHVAGPVLRQIEY